MSYPPFKALSLPSRQAENEPITSLENPQVKLVRSLHEPAGRRRHRAFLVEGVRLVEAAAAAAAPRLVLHAETFGRRDARERALLRTLRATGVSVRPASGAVLRRVCDTTTPQGIVAVMPLPAPGQRQAAARDTGTELNLILDAISDPGNAGTLLRSAVAAGVGRVYAAPGTVDLYSPKVVRAGAGAHFLAGIETGLDWAAIAADLPPAAPVYRAEARCGAPYWSVDWRASATLIVSNEARGASPDARAASSRAIAIPMVGNVESLNAAVAGSVILFEALRQRLEGGTFAGTGDRASEQHVEKHSITGEMS